MKRVLMLAILLLPGSPTLAAGATLPAPVQQAVEPTIRKCSTGVIKVWGFIKVGQASVWLPDCSRLHWPLEPPVLLRFGYEREVPGDAFAESALAMLERNLGEQTFNNLEPRFIAFNANYRDTREGDIYSMLYQADGSLTLWLNDRQLGREQGHDFARHYLKIWFGPDPFSDKLKQALLTPAT